MIDVRASVLNRLTIKKVIASCIVESSQHQPLEFNFSFGAPFPDLLSALDAVLASLLKLLCTVAVYLPMGISVLKILS